MTRADTGNTFTVAGRSPPHGTVRNDMACAQQHRLLRHRAPRNAGRARDPGGRRGAGPRNAGARRPAVWGATRCSCTLAADARDPDGLHEAEPEPDRRDPAEDDGPHPARAGHGRAGIAVVDSAMRAWGMPQRKLAQADRQRPVALQLGRPCSSSSCWSTCARAHNGRPLRCHAGGRRGRHPAQPHARHPASGQRPREDRHRQQRALAQRLHDDRRGRADRLQHHSQPPHPHLARATDWPRRRWRGCTGCSDSRSRQLAPHFF